MDTEQMSTLQVYCSWVIPALLLPLAMQQLLQQYSNVPFEGLLYVYYLFHF